MYSCNSFVLRALRLTSCKKKKKENMKTLILNISFTLLFEMPFSWTSLCFFVFLFMKIRRRASANTGRSCFLKWSLFCIRDCPCRPTQNHRNQIWIISHVFLLVNWKNLDRSFGKANLLSFSKNSKCRKLPKQREKTQTNKWSSRSILLTWH